MFSALKIQITGECKTALEDLGGYNIERRGVIEIKVQLAMKCSSISVLVNACISPLGITFCMKKLPFY